VRVKESGHEVEKHSVFVTPAAQRPLLFLDVDGVISLFGFRSSQSEAPGQFHWIDGVAHCIPSEAGERLERLAVAFDLVWATGWEERANDHLPFILKLPFQELPCLTFDGRAMFGSSHWKLDAIEEYSAGRPAAWIDDNMGDAARLWALARREPTLLVETESAKGMTEAHVEELLRWADNLTPTSARRSSEAA
jgi:hypothetical protein